MGLTARGTDCGVPFWRRSTRIPSIMYQGTYVLLSPQRDHCSRHSPKALRMQRKTHHDSKTPTYVPYVRTYVSHQRQYSEKFQRYCLVDKKEKTKTKTKTIAKAQLPEPVYASLPLHGRLEVSRNEHGTGGRLPTVRI